MSDPRESQNPISSAYSMLRDEREEFPTEALDWLYGQGLQRQFVPADLGGDFTSFEQLASLIRVLSRRDLTSSITFSTLFWSFLTWLSGTEDQKRWLARFIQDENGAMCLAYSERHHGSDLLGGDTVAARTPEGYVLTGEKWPINRATVAGLCFVLATTDPDAGPRGLSLFMVNKKDLARDQYAHLPKILTHGIRGSDMSGIRFDSCAIPEASLLGGEGMGLELALKGFQITRALCAAFSLGAADTALRTTLRFGVDRTLYGHNVVELPHARRVLADAFIDILIADCVATAGMRAFHVVPEQASVWASVVKYFVPTTIERAIHKLSVVLGARYYMREEHDGGVFQKAMRDSAIISVFDGSTVVNLHALLLQMRHLARSSTTPPHLESRLQQLFSLEQAVDAVPFERMSLASRSGDNAWRGLELTLARMRGLRAGPQLASEVLDDLDTLTTSLATKMREHDTGIRETTFESGHLQSPELFELAREHCVLHAAATCVHLWIHNRTPLGGFFGSGCWLALALQALLSDVGVRVDRARTNDYVDRAADEFMTLLRDDRMFSITRLQLAKSRTP